MFGIKHMASCVLTQNFRHSVGDICLQLKAPLASSRLVCVQMTGFCVWAQISSFSWNSVMLAQMFSCIPAHVFLWLFSFVSSGINYTLVLLSGGGQRAEEADVKPLVCGCLQMKSGTVFAFITYFAFKKSKEKESGLIELCCF